MAILPSSTYARQKWLIIGFLLLLVVVPALGSLSWAVFDWPAFPELGEVSRERYEDRADLLKYMISLGLSIIGASWFLVTRESLRISSDDRDYKLLSWSWTFIGIGVLIAFLELFLCYKEHYYDLPETKPVTFYMLRVCGYLYALQMTFRFAVGTFLVGGITLIFSALGILHNKHFPESIEDKQQSE